MTATWSGVILVLGALAGLLAGLRRYQLRRQPHPETVRKLLHVGMGLVAVPLPWLFPTPWPVVTLALLAVAAFTLLRWRDLPGGLGAVLHAVQRTSIGEIYFPVAIAALFLLSGGDPLLYCIPVIVLAVADASAALAGIRYGTVHFATGEGRKSLEGSVAFFCVACFSVHVPLLLFSSVGRAETLLVALILGLLVMLFEAIAWRGLDNLFIPLGTYALLKSLLPLGADALVGRLGAIVLLLAFTLAWRKRTTLIGNALLAAALIGYFTWVMGGWVFLVAPLLMFVGYTRTSPETEMNRRKVHDLRAVVCVCSAGLLWLYVRVHGGGDVVLYPYTLAYAAHLAITAVARVRFDRPELSAVRVLAWATVVGWAFQFVPFVALAGLQVRAVLLALAALLPVGAAAVAFYRLQPEIADCPTDTPRWWRQGLLAWGASLAGFELTRWLPP